jgi:hypothetical protein
MYFMITDCGVICLWDTYKLQGEGGEDLKGISFLLIGGDLT